MDVPKEGALEKYLEVLGDMTLKSFIERVRRYRLERELSERDELMEIITRANDEQVRQIFLIAKALLAVSFGGNSS